MIPAQVTPRARFIGLASIYGLLVVYVSTVLGPGGVNFQPLELGSAWARFLATRFDANDPLLSSDWNGNLLMLVPLGVLVTGALWPRRGGLSRALAATLAFGFCLIFLLAVKFAQIFFPPRTVSLNYILAQSIGALIGVGLFITLRRPLRQLPRQGRGLLIGALRIYAIFLFALLLFPFDFLSSDAVRERLTALPALLLLLPGEGRPLPWQAVFIAVSTLETVPFGLLIALYCRRRRVLGATAIGLGAMSGVFLMQLAVASAAPSGVGVLCHTLGITGGAVFGAWLQSADLVRWRYHCAKAVPALVPLYLLVLLWVNDVIATDWRSPAQAWAALDWHGLLPLWHDYIVSKSHALKSTVAHFGMYAPIGTMIWLRRGRSGRGLALALAAPLAFAIEIARWFRPELQPDFTNTLIAGAAAALAVPFSAWIWDLVEHSFAPAGAIPGMTGRPFPPAAMAPPPGAVPGMTADASGSARRRSLSFWMLRAPASGACVLATLAILSRYPLSPWPLAAALGVYAAALWRWPGIWLLVVPTVLPALDLGQWTGWLYFGESDLFILITIAVLLVLPPAPRTGLPLTRFALFALLLSIFTYGASIAVGLWLVPAVPTDNPYLSAWNALRIAKGFFLALALFPFLRRDILLRTNTLEWFGAGMISGLLLVAAGIIVERAVFASLFDFSGEYRVSAAFTSMHIGGGHIGAYLAMAIPFLSLCVIGERAGLLVGAVLSTIAGYALAVTFARTAYAATILAVVISGVGWAVAARRARQSHAMRPLLGGLAIAAFIGAAALGSPFMHERLANADAGLAGREANWISGLSVHNADLATALVGMGLGTFPRVYRSRAIDAPVPTDFVVRHADGRSWLVIRPGPSSFYFGQKVGVTATGSYTLLVDLRAPNGAATVSFGLCEKLLLYSDNCRSVAFTVTPGEWRHERAILQVDRLTAPALFGLIRRPVELSFSIGGPNATAEITGVRLLDAQQNDLVHNGEFAQGSDRWLFTSDDHRAWRIFDQPLMVWFEQGAFGLAAYLCLCAAALLGLWRAISVGNRTAAPFIAAIAGYLCSGFFDFLLEAPRLSTLFYLFCFTGLAIPKWPKAIAGVQ